MVCAHTLIDHCLQSNTNFLFAPSLMKFSLQNDHNLTGHEMDDKSNSPPPAPRRYHRIVPLPIDESLRTNVYSPQFIPTSIESRPSAAAATLSRKRRRCSITNEPSSPSPQLPYYSRDFTYDRSHLAAMGTQKRSAQDDAAGSHTTDSYRSDAQFVSTDEASPRRFTPSSPFSQPNGLATSTHRASSSKINRHAHRSIAIPYFSIIVTNRICSHRPGHIHRWPLNSHRFSTACCRHYRVAPRQLPIIERIVRPFISPIRSRHCYANTIIQRSFRTRHCSPPTTRVRSPVTDRPGMLHCVRRTSCSTTNSRRSFARATSRRRIPIRRANPRRRARPTISTSIRTSTSRNRGDRTASARTTSICSI